MNTRAHHRVFAAAAAVLAAPLAAQPHMPSPVISGPDEEAVREVRLDAAMLHDLRAQDGPVRLTGFPLPRAASADLLIEPFDVLTPDARVVLGGAEGDIEIGQPAVWLYRGAVVGEPDSTVFLSFSTLGANGIIQIRGETFVLSSGEFGAGRTDEVIAGLSDFPEPPEFAGGWECQVGPEHVNPLGLDLNAIDDDAGDHSRSNPCRIARVAIEGDYEYTAWLFGGDADAAAAYSVTLLGAVSEIYTRDLNVRLLVPFIRLWEDEGDPYDGDKLSQFRDEWNANMRHVERELAHLLSGNYGGGVAWVSVLCHNSYGYGLSGVGGGFPYPLRDHDHGNWDPFVVSHELGHNFGTLHTHDGYDPTIDDCGNGDCSMAYGGTIMSYCHTCAGGMSNIVLAFHPRIIAQVSNYLNGACNILGDDIAYAYDDEGVTLEDLPGVIDVLANDIPLNCSPPGIFSVQGTTDQGGTADISEGTGQDGRDEILYTPPPGFTGTDSFFYLMQTDNGALTDASVHVDVIDVRPADELGVSRPDVTADYYELQTAEQLPDFSLLTPYARDRLDQINIPSSHGNFATSGRYEYVGAVFSGYVLVPQTGRYTLFIESDDGSRLLLGDELLIDNDGVHGMTERPPGSAGLAAGWHRVRIEYFEKNQAQGLIVRMQGPDLPKQPIPPGMWRTDECVADWTSDGAVNTIDFILFLADWNLRDPTTDLNGDGLSNTSDVVVFLNVWVDGCP